MENENTIKEEKKVVTPFDEVEIGEDIPQIEPATCVIDTYRMEMQKNKEGKELGNKLTLLLKHPGVTDKLIEISGVKYNKAEKLTDSGLWINFDKDGKLPYKSATAIMLRHLKKKNITELKGEQVETIADKAGYLVIKAY